jgi:hypothetical protein
LAITKTEREKEFFMKFFVIMTVLSMFSLIGHAETSKLWCGFKAWHLGWSNEDIFPTVTSISDVNGVNGMGGLELNIPAHTGLCYIYSQVESKVISDDDVISFYIKSEAKCSGEIALYGRKVWSAPFVSNSDGEWQSLQIPIKDFKYYNTYKRKSRRGIKMGCNVKTVKKLYIKIWHSGNKQIQVELGPIFIGTPPEKGSDFSVIPKAGGKADTGEGDTDIFMPDAMELSEYFKAIKQNGERQKWQRPIPLWKYYTYGITDHFAKRLKIKKLLEGQENPDQWLCNSVKLPISFRHSDYDVVKLDGTAGKGSLTFPQVLPIDIVKYQGKNIRLFIWIKAEKPSLKFSKYPDFHSRPEMNLVFKDDKDKIIKSSCGYFITPGPYPWHCYNMETYIPENCKEIYLSLSSLGGVAYFAAPSWEPVDKLKGFSKDDCQDPFSGSMSKNVYNDTLDTLYRNGSSVNRYICRWLQGSSIGLKGAKADLTTNDGLRYYYEKIAKTGKEINGFNQLITAFPGIIKRLDEAGIMPHVEDGLINTLADIIKTAQLDNGLWAVDLWPDGSDGLTCHTLTKCFYYRNIPREDPDYSNSCKTFRDPRLPGLKEVPRPEKLIRTFADRQIEYKDKDGRLCKAGWHGNHGFPASRRRSDMQTTANTIFSMRIALCDVKDPGVKKLCYQSVKSAVESVLRFNVLPDWGWKHSNLQDRQTINSYMPWIMGISPYLERKIRKDIPAPQVTCQQDDGSVKVSWTNPAKYNGIRIYSTPAEIIPTEIDEKFLTGIIHRQGHAPIETDPIIVDYNIREAVKKRFGNYPRSSFGWKQRKLEQIYPVKFSVDAAPLEITSAPNQDIWVSTVTWYGEESPPVKVKIIK